MRRVNLIGKAGTEGKYGKQSITGKSYLAHFSWACQVTVYGLIQKRHGPTILRLNLERSKKRGID